MAEVTETDDAETERSPSAVGRLLALLADNQRPLAGGLLVVVLVLPVVLSPSRLYLMTLVFIYALLAFSAVVPIGYANLLSLCQGAFFGIGAYSFVLLTTSGVPSWVSVVLAVLVTAAIALVLGLPAIRASGIYLGIITLVFNLLFVLVLNVFSDIFGGEQGLPSPGLNFAGLDAVVPEVGLYYYLVVLVFLAVLLWLQRLLSTAVGWGFLAMQDDLDVAESIGIDTRRYRLLAFVLSGALGGLGGGLYAPTNGYISPATFNLDATIDIILAAVIGGIAVPAGTVVGSLFTRFAPELLGIVANFRLVLYGILLILVLIYLPDGVGGRVQDALDDRDD
jgi:branched-chain amino acid transport system permease protein